LLLSSPNLSCDTNSSLTAKRQGHWLKVLSHLDPKYGGLSVVVPELGSAISSQGAFSIEIAGFCSPDERSLTGDLQGIEVSRWPSSRLQWLKDRSLRSHFLDRCERADGIHIHGLWEQSTAMAAHAARRLGKPYIVSAHGMLERWALANKKLKKQLYAALLERANIESAACLHALTRAEAEDYRKFGSRRPIAIIPNGVRVPRSASSDAFLEKFPALKGRRIILYLGRIHFKKGLDLLVEAWSRLADDWPDAQLVLAGPDFENTQLAIERLISSRRLDRRVVLAGMLRGDLKWSALAAAECFVLPSHSEGLSVSVLEAMGIGLPVIVTRQCNLPEIAQYGAGRQIEPDIGELADALSEYLNRSDTANREIGNRGKKLVSERYCWSVVGKQMSELYAYLEGGPQPRTFEFEMNLGRCL
jgi:glycosyltransferase involved in cell wall biosynthesis